MNARYSIVTQEAFWLDPDVNVAVISKIKFNNIDQLELK